MTEIAPIFEIHCSTLTRSNDGDLTVHRLSQNEALKAGAAPPAGGYGVWSVTTGEYVFSTQSRVLADAYIAGYDLGSENQ